MSTVGTLHQKLVYSRRTKVLASELANAIPANSLSILDVGCGDGTIDSLILQHRPGLSITGLDVLVRPKTFIPVWKFDGTRLPYDDQSFDVVMFADVLHHTTDPECLLREAKRVAKVAVVLKDHTRDGFLSNLTLRFMDWVGNAHHNVVLPYNYWPRSRWMLSFQSIGLNIQRWNETLGLYPAPASWVFERRLHFVACLTV